MSKAKIPQPKVFLSYARGTEEYQKKVLSFATSLMNDGVNVVLDLWHLTEGDDTHAYMEQCVKDDSITNVLMLLNPMYKQKADDHRGGVGTETQIISPEVYHNVKNDKFLPVVFERNEAGEVCLPIYLRSRLYFDLSLPEKYDLEYKRLVRKLFGADAYPIPEIGTMPSWVEDESVIDVKTSITYDVLKENVHFSIKQSRFSEFLNGIKDKIVGSESNQTVNSSLIEYYDSLASIRSQYLTLIQNFVYVEGSAKLIGEFLESTKNSFKYSVGGLDSIRAIFVHELFLYTVALFLKSKNFSLIGDLLKRTYFIARYDNGRTEAGTFHKFYSGSVQSYFDEVINKRDDKQYYSGTSKYWMENIDPLFCTKDEFVCADLVCFNYSIFNGMATDGLFGLWFPETYVYDNSYCSSLRDIAVRMVSLEQLMTRIPMFGFVDAERFKQKFKEIDKQCKQGMYRDYRYHAGFDAPHILCDFIEPDKIGTLP